MMKAYLKVPLLLFSIVAISACTSLPKQLDSTNPELVTDYALWKAAPEKNNELRLGGVIAKVTNLKSSTRVEVVNLISDFTGKPDLNKEPTGRFVVYLDGFVDPAALTEGRLITVLGSSNGTEVGEVGEFSYTFPTMTATAYHLWRVEQRVIMDDFGRSIYPCVGLYCAYHRVGPSQGRVIKEVQ